ncbi:Hep_Hag [Chryseobacterium carnipullorum]|uniref:Hep_Hag n=1 Tax=Chryseobacterium carnipullorum TaxID=1124835 RepID=A0A376E0S6_CHRCU|nr:Hep_Hag [Chryseobacterium carnipullorum]
MNEATAVGNNADASGFQSLALGYNAKTTTNDATSVGKNSTASGFQSTAVGYNAKTNTNSETAVGYNTVTNNQNSTAVGSGANALGQFSTAVGYGAVTSQANAIVIGNNNANVGIGTATPNTSVKIDVNGQYKLGEKGSIQKNQISFEAWPSVSVNNLAAGKSVTLEIAIPANLQPGSARAAIVVSPAGDFAGNTSFSISNPRMTSTSSVTINLTNISGNTESLYSGHFYVMINEF